MILPDAAWPSHTRAVNLRAVACVRTCTELFGKRWLFAGVVLNAGLLEQHAGCCPCCAWAPLRGSRTPGLAPQHPVPTPPAPPAPASGSAHPFPPRWSPGEAAVELRGSRFPCEAGVPWDCSTASEQSCAVRYMEGVQDGHLLALKQSSAFSKYLWPLFLMFTFKKIQACVSCKRKGGKKNHCYCH